MKHIITRLTLLLAAALAGCTPTLVHFDERPQGTAHRAPAPPPARERSISIRITPARGPSGQAQVAISEARGTLEGTNLTVAEMVCLAHRTPARADTLVPPLSPFRVVPMVTLPSEAFDIQLAAPGASAARMRQIVGEQLARQFNIRVRREPRSMETLVVVAPEGRLREAQPGDLPTPTGARRIDLSGTDTALLAEQLEFHMQRPVIDSAGLRGEYRLQLRVPAPNGSGGLQPVHHPPPAVDLVSAELRNQLGLSAVIEQRPIEMLVVESTNPPPAQPALQPVPG